MNNAMIQDYIHQFLHFAPRLASAFVVLLLFWGAGRILATLLLRSPMIVQAEGGLGTVLASAVRVGFITIGAITALGSAGVDVKALVAGLGLGGFALGFALKDMLSNALSGLLILLYRPFRSGSHISVAGNQGQVREVNLRYTVVENAEGARFLIPNSKIFTEVIVVSA